jgi:hypothetical protein
MSNIGFMELMLLGAVCFGSIVVLATAVVVVVLATNRHRNQGAGGTPGATLGGSNGEVS